MSVLVFVAVVVGWGAPLGRLMGGTGTWLPTGGAVGSASLTQVKSEDGSADVDVAMGMLGVVVLVGLGWLVLSRYGAHAGELMSTVVGLRLHSLYPYAHPTRDRDDYAPLGWVMTLYRTEPSDAVPWGGEIVDTALDTAWYPTRSKCSDVAHHAAWRLNGERVPGSSFGTTGPAGQPSPTWRYGVVIAADPPWHGYAFQWVAVSPGDVVYGPDLRSHPRPRAVLPRRLVWPRPDRRGYVDRRSAPAIGVRVRRSPGLLLPGDAVRRRSGGGSLGGRGSRRRSRR